MAKRLHADPSRALARFKRDVSMQPAPTSSAWEVGHIQARHDQTWKNIGDAVKLGRKFEDVTRTVDADGVVTEGGGVSKAWGGVKSGAGKIKDYIAKRKQDKQRKGRLQKSLSGETYDVVTGAEYEGKDYDTVGETDDLQQDKSWQDDEDFGIDESTRLSPKAQSEQWDRTAKSISQVYGAQEAGKKYDETAESMSQEISGKEYDKTAESMSKFYEAQEAGKKPEPPTIQEKLQKVKAMGGTALKGLAYGAAMTNPVTGAMATAYGLNKLQQKKHDKEYYARSGQARIEGEQEQLTEREVLKEYQGDEPYSLPEDKFPKSYYESNWSYGDKLQRMPQVGQGEEWGVFDKSDDYGQDLREARKDPKFMKLMEEKLGKEGFKRWQRRYDKNRGKKTTVGGKLVEKGRQYVKRIAQDRAVKKLTPEITKMGETTIFELNNTYMSSNPDVAVDWESLMKENKNIAQELTEDIYTLGITDPAEQKEFVRLSYAITLGINKEQVGKPNWKLLGGDRGRETSDAPTSTQKGFTKSGVQHPLYSATEPGNYTESEIGRNVFSLSEDPKMRQEKVSKEYEEYVTNRLRSR
jgi:hypothetical protein